MESTRPTEELVWYCASSLNERLAAGRPTAVSKAWVSASGVASPPTSTVGVSATPARKRRRRVQQREVEWSTVTSYLPVVIYLALMHGRAAATLAEQ